MTFLNQWRRGLVLAAICLMAGTSSVLAADNSDWPAQKQKMIDLGKSYKSAWDLYQHFKSQAHGGETPAKAKMPDWRGLWERDASPFFFDPDQKGFNSRPTAKLTPAYEKELDKRLKAYKAGNDFDPISICGVPAQFPRWLVEPFMREFVPTPDQTWMMNENLNETRRIYTDGRGHEPKEAAYPLYEGDSIGFWDHGRLIVHTSQLRAGMYQRIQPRFSDKVQTVEIWQRVGDKLQADVWIYDPEGLTEPWFTRQTYHQVPNKNGLIRIRFWACAENPNNDITLTKQGGSTFTDFTFTSKDDKAKKEKK